ncbi:hypothetical protein Q1695_013491 [Nippostrongylus brasiliensis]|nr:hypothetical protein Q1695_013491 [Nippostrongylus brasiliensis]
MATHKSELRAALANLLSPLLELLVQPGERPLPAKMSIYESVRLCLKTAYVKVDEKAAGDSADDWLITGHAFTGSTTINDPIAEVLNTMGYELSQSISRDIVDLPHQHK